ncbi:MAG: hypothetical protein ACJ72D_10025 [Marmoricola sp.]
MISHHAPKNARTDATRTRALVRRAVIASAAGLFALASVPGIAFADEPAAWGSEPHVSGWQFLVVLVLIPAGLFLVISLLAALPSMIRDKGYEPGQSWRSEPEWFGGPRKGLEAAEGSTPAQIEAAEAEQGGTSGTW